MFNLTDTKKVEWIALVGILLLGMLTGCGSKESAVIGTWYSDQDSESILMLKKDHTYTDGSWLLSGDFSVEDDKIVMVGALEGTTILQIEKEDGNIILRYYNSDGSIDRTFYDSTEKAQEVLNARKEAEQLEKEEQAAAEIKALKDGVIGYWYNENMYPVEFTNDGRYIEYTVDGLQEGKYEVLSGDKIAIVKSDGSEWKWSAQFGDDGTLTFDYRQYIKAEPLELSDELLLGEWFSSTYYEESPSREFYDNGTFAIKSAMPEYVEDTILTYSVSSDNTYFSTSEIFPEGITRYAYLSKTETDYQLYMAQTMVTFGESSTSLVFLSRPVVND